MIENAEAVLERLCDCEEKLTALACPVHDYENFVAARKVGDEACRREERFRRALDAIAEMEGETMSEAGDAVDIAREALEAVDGDGVEECECKGGEFGISTQGCPVHSDVGDRNSDSEPGRDYPYDSEAARRGEEEYPLDAVAGAAPRDADAEGDPLEKEMRSYGSDLLASDLETLAEQIDAWDMISDGGYPNLLREAARRLRRGGGESGADLDPYDWYLVARDDDCACGHEFSMHTSHGCLFCDCGVEIMYGWACADRLRDAPSEEGGGDGWRRDSSRNPEAIGRRVLEYSSVLYDIRRFLTYATAKQGWRDVLTYILSGEGALGAMGKDRSDLPGERPGGGGGGERSGDSEGDGASNCLILSGLLDGSDPDGWRWDCPDCGRWGLHRNEGRGMPGHGCPECGGYDTILRAVYNFDRLRRSTWHPTPAGGRG